MKSDPLVPRIRLGWLLGLSIVLGLSTGCTPSGEATYPVSGLVRFSDGRVLREGSVEFEIIGRTPPITATSLIASDGTFTLGTFTLDDGALPGEHRVAIFSDPMIGTGAERPGLIPESPLPPRYSSFDNSGIVLSVLPEDNQLIIEIESVAEPQP